MLRLRPDVAIDTEASVFPPASFADFVARVRVILVAVLSESAVEIVHHPARGGQQLREVPFLELLSDVVLLVHSFAFSRLLREVSLSVGAWNFSARWR